MLKIKDNVDLKELEKFGFELKQHDGYLNRHSVYEKRFGVGDIHIYPNKEYRKDYERKMFFHTYYQSYYYDSNNEALETLYDLIKAGLVEKVES